MDEPPVTRIQAYPPYRVAARMSVALQPHAAVGNAVTPAQCAHCGHTLLDVAPRYLTQGRSQWYCICFKCRWMTFWNAHRRRTEYGEEWALVIQEGEQHA